MRNETANEAELQFDLAPTDGFEDQIQDMSNIAMQFGFITLFITALPCLSWRGSLIN